jgi:hypothetical protein
VLEPDEGKLSSPVLRGLSGRKAARLPGDAPVVSDPSGLPVVTKDCGNSVLDFAFGTVPTDSNRVCGVPQPSAFQKLERHFLEFSGDIGRNSFLPNRTFAVEHSGLS